NTILRDAKMTSKQQEPVFIIGVDRSGTTLLNMMLDAHPELLITYESGIIHGLLSEDLLFKPLTTTDSKQHLITKLLSLRGVKKWQEVFTLDDFNFEEINNASDAIRQLYGCYLKRTKKCMWGDKDPIYTALLEYTHSLFPNAKFIHIIRDGRDVASSISKQWWGPNTFPKALDYWQHSVTTLSRMLSMLPNSQKIEIRYEDLVENTEETLHDIVDFLELPYDDIMLGSYSSNAEDKLGDLVSTIHAQLKKRPSKEHLYKWKHKLTRADLAITFELAHDTLRRYGYESKSVTSIMKIPRKIYYVFLESYLWHKNKRRLRKNNE
ncbi:MAG: sulfotransferase, partial [Methylococcales bacterium]|nr:sulfotransferase [Methylococcales bacterium]